MSIKIVKRWGGTGEPIQSQGSSKFLEESSALHHSDFYKQLRHFGGWFEKVEYFQSDLKTKIMIGELFDCHSFTACIIHMCPLGFQESLLVAFGHLGTSIVKQPPPSQPRKLVAVVSMVCPPNGQWTNTASYLRIYHFWDVQLPKCLQDCSLLEPEAYPAWKPRQRKALRERRDIQPIEL